MTLLRKEAENVVRDWLSSSVVDHDNPNSPDMIERGAMRRLCAELTVTEVVERIVKFNIIELQELMTQLREQGVVLTMKGIKP